MLPAEVAFEDAAQRDAAEAALDLVVAKAAAIADRPWLDRRAIAAQVDELARARALGGDSLRLGLTLDADLLVLPTLARSGEAWTLRLDVIDPAKADVLATTEGGVALDDVDADAWARRLSDALAEADAALAAARGKTTLAVLFFANVTGTERLDAYHDHLGDALRDGDEETLRVLRFPQIAASQGEQQLALAGLTSDPGRWREVADWWVWGEYRELDWEGEAFEDVTVEVAATVWDGVHEPVVLRERGKVGERAALAAAVSEAVREVVAAGAGNGKAVEPSTLAGELLERARALQAQNVGGQWGVTAAWRARWHHELRLLQLAAFIDAENPALAIEYLRSRWRDDMSVTSGPNSGRVYHGFGQTHQAWLVDRAEAWGDFVGRFGLAGSWERQYQSQRNSTDNRTRSTSVAGEFLGSVEAVQSYMPDGTLYRDAEEWPMLSEPQLFSDAWAAEGARRLNVVLDAADAGGPEAAHYASLAENSAWRILEALVERQPKAARQVIDRLLPRMDEERRAWLNKYKARLLRQIGEGVGDPAWAEQLIASLPEPMPDPEPVAPKPRRPVERRPSTLPVLATLEPLSDGVDFGERWSVSVAAMAAWGDAWLAAGHGQDLGTDGLDISSPLFWHTGDEPGFRRIHATLKTGNVAGFAQHGSTIWIASADNGVTVFDLDTRDWKRFGLDAGLPTLSYGAVGVDEAGRPTVVSGRDVTPTMATFDGERWLARRVELFAEDERFPPIPNAVAVSGNAVVIAARYNGRGAALVRLDQTTGEWFDLLAPLITHLEEAHDFSAIKFGKQRFGAKDVLRAPGGSFLLVHDFGVTHLSEAGEILRTQPFGFGRYFNDYGDALLSADGERLWIGGNVHRGSGACLIEVELAEPGTVTFLDVPRSLRMPAALAQQGDTLLVGGQLAGDAHVLRFPLASGRLAASR